MKKGNLILLVTLSSMLFIACKNDKATKAMDSAKDAVENTVENVVDAAEEVVEEVGDELADVDITSGNDQNSIGSDELKELKKAEAEEAKTPKVSNEKGTRPSTSTKPKAGSKSSGSPKPQKPASSTKPAGSSTVTKPKVSSIPKAEGSDTSGSNSAGSSSGSSTSTGTNTKESKTKVEEVKEAVEEVVEEVVEAPMASGTTTGSQVKEVKDKPTGTSGEPIKVGKITKPGSTGTSTSTNMNTNASGLNHDAFNSMLNKFVSSTGVVNYGQLKASSRSLNSYCKNLSDNPPQDSWSKNEKLAYWLNAYNAFTLKLITDNYPLGSITELNGGKPWDKKWITIGSQTLSLNGIENDIIRPRFNDARIHFGLNCAAKSCPPLANYAFTADNVNSKLTALTKSFINGSANQLSGGDVSISKLFDWYKADFGDVIGYINRYANTKVDAGANIKYMDYDWSLNGN